MIRCLLMLCIVLPSARADFDHSTWNQLLKRHVVVLNGGNATQVDYGAVAEKRADLLTYLNALKSVEEDQFDSWSEPAQLAFLINAYNAYTIELILTEYPDLKSIRDLGSLFTSPWEKEFFELLGKTRSLDELEHQMIRGAFSEPRIHFAVNCASIGCPALRAEAYSAADLENQLEDQARRFLADRSRNRVEGDELQVSKIFDWYQDDFAKGWRDAESLAEFLGLYGAALGLDDSQRKALKAGDLDIEFLKYDWSLNDVSR